MRERKILRAEEKNKTIQKETGEGGERTPVFVRAPLFERLEQASYSVQGGSNI